MKKLSNLKVSLILITCTLSQVCVGYAAWTTISNNAVATVDNMTINAGTIINLSDGISVVIDNSKFKMGKYTYNYDNSSHDLGILTYNIKVVPSLLPADLKIENSAKTAYVFSLNSTISTKNENAIFSSTYIDSYVYRDSSNELTFDSSSYGTDSKSLNLSFTINTSSKGSDEENFYIDIKFKTKLILDYKDTFISNGNHFNFSLNQGE